MQRVHFGLPLLDEDFQLPKKPWTVTDHDHYISQMDSTLFDQLMEHFVMGPGGEYFTRANSSGNPARPNTSFTLPIVVDNNTFTQKAPTSNRPELRPSSWNFHTFSQTKPSKRRKKNTYHSSSVTTSGPWLDAIKRNAIYLINVTDSLAHFENALTDSDILKSKSPLINIEESLFNMSAFPDCVEGVFYISKWTSMNGKSYIRFFEHSVYSGLIEKFRDQDMTSDILWQTFTRQDILAANQTKYTAQKKRPRADMFYRSNLEKNATSIKNNIPKLLEAVSSLEDIKLTGLMVHTVYKGHQFTENQQQTDRW